MKRIATALLDDRRSRTRAPGARAARHGVRHRGRQARLSGVVRELPRARRQPDRRHRLRARRISPNVLERRARDADRRRHPEHADAAESDDEPRPGVAPGRVPALDDRGTRDRGRRRCAPRPRVVRRQRRVPRLPRRARSRARASARTSRASGSCAAPARSSVRCSTPRPRSSPRIASTRCRRGTVSAVVGRLLNRDTYTVQLIDLDERLRSFQIAALSEHGFDDTPMPPARDKLSTQEIADVVSYLSSLRGEAAPREGTE